VTAQPADPEYVRYSKHGHVAVITLNRPERLNAMGRDVLAGLASSMMAFEADDDARVAVLTGTGRALSVGMDIKEKAASPEEDPAALPDISPLVNKFFPFRKDDFDKPIIAAVNGLALGGGFFLAANSDLVVAAEDAVFEVSEVQRGWVAGWWYGRLLNLPRHIGMELALGGRMTAERAYQVGFVNEVVPAEQLLDAALARAERIAALPPLAVRHTRSLFMEASPTVGEPTWRRWEQAMAEVTRSEDVLESRRAFLEKREPRFRGR
jgi:enoyl-CoA hydratase/carnithine racemase